MSKLKINCLQVEASETEIENVRAEKQKKESLGKKIVKRVKSKTLNKNSCITRISEPKIFTIYDKRKMVEPIRKELLSRGWTEKMIDDTTTQLAKFVWLSRSNSVVIEGNPIVNRLKLEPRKNFCFKDVLVDYGRAVKCTKKTELNVPRSFKLFSNEKKDFMEDYRLTAYSSFIRFLHATGSDAFSASGRINSNWIQFAIGKLEAAIFSGITSDKNAKNSETKENLSKEKAEKSECDFQRFKKIYQSVVKYNSKVAANSEERKELLLQCEIIYKKCKTMWKDFDKDGFYNLWLLKPARRSLGIGIKLFDEEDDILSYAKDYQHMEYLVQKYVERPMLIYNTKFDLRQYFLIVHHAKGICLWMYKMSYLKFSTKLYDPLNYKVSVHITNTAVQSKYSIDKNRSRNIPQCNEWSSDRFLAYLKRGNQLNLWYDQIYPGMKKTIITTVSSAVNLAMIQPDHFQLYGCDFVIDENHDPILLEVNGMPILTSVICSMCLQDLVKDEKIHMLILAISKRCGKKVCNRRDSTQEMIKKFVTKVATAKNSRSTPLICFLSHLNTTNILYAKINQR